jgi:hypothetical protein
MHDITINQDASLATTIIVDGVQLQMVISYNVTQGGPLQPITLTVVTHDPDAPPSVGVPRFPEVTTVYPIRSLTVTTANEGS